VYACHGRWVVTAAELVAIPIVDNPEDCAICTPDQGNEGWCKDCVNDFIEEQHLHSELMYGTGKKGHRYLDKIPDHPSLN
jgi:hypothetical protein